MLDAFYTATVYLLAFLSVLSLAYITTRMIASGNKKRFQTKNIKVLEGVMIAPQKFIQLVKIGDKIMAICVTKDNVTHLYTFSENEIKFDVSINDKDQMENKFSEILEKLINSKKGK